MHNQSYFTTGGDTKLFIQEWKPEKNARAIVLYVHGLGSHSGRMEHWAERFVNEQLIFFAYDHRGHGKSDEKQGHPKNTRILISDLKKMVSHLRETYPGLPVILYGHSLGGNIAVNYVISETSTVDALILTSPWLRLSNPPSKRLIQLVKPLMKIAPGLTLSNGLKAEDLSHDAEAVEKYKTDPLVHDRISIGLFYTAYTGGLHALRNVYKINCPFLIMHGTEDKITSVKASENYVMNTSDRARLKLWEGAFHELHNEPEKEQVFEYIINWMKEKNILGK